MAGVVRERLTLGGNMTAQQQLRILLGTILGLVLSLQWSCGNDPAFVENGSMQFDQASLSPTYKLMMGIPGSSYLQRDH